MNGEETFGDRLARQARTFVDAAGSRTSRFARVGRLQLDLLGIRREMSRELEELGARTLELYRRGEASRIADDPLAGPILARIERLESERIEREAQIEEIRASVPHEEDLR